MTFLRSLNSYKRRRTPLAGRLARVATTSVAIVTLGLAIAAPPPAGSIISNFATANYRDRDGIARDARSNTVDTIVRQIGAFMLETDRNLAGGPNQKVPALHILTNTGNGTTNFNITVEDTAAPALNFTSIEVYADNGNNGPNTSALLCATPQVGATPLCGAGGGLANIAVNPGASNAFRFWVLYQLPANAGTDTNWLNTGNQALVTATADNSAGITFVTPETQTNTDTLLGSNSAVFRASKAIQSPSISPPSGSWPTAATSGPRSPASASCPTTWPLTSAAPECIYTVYRVTYSNVGAAPGTIAIRDTLPSGMTYVTGSAVWSNASGTALNEANGASDDPAGINYEFSSGEFRATVANVGSSDSGSLNFVVLINSTAVVGTSTTTNFADFSSTDCTSAAAGSACVQSTTTGAAFEVLATHGVIAANQQTTTDDVANGGTKGNPPKSGVDVVVVPSAPTGSRVPFRVFVMNTGNDTDIYDITIDQLIGTVDFPTGTTFDLFRSDGIQALTDSVSDNGSVVDTGPVGAGDRVEIVVVANLPNNAPIGTPATPHEALVIARSSLDMSGSPNSVDAVWLQLNTVSSALIDLTNSQAGTPDADAATDNGDIGPGPSALPTTTKTLTRGQTTTFPLWIANNTASGQVFSLERSQNRTFPGTVPTGWEVTFHAAGGTCGVNPITSVAVGSNAQVQVMACVSVRTTATLGTTNLFFRVVSTTDATLMDTKLDAVTVEEEDRPEFTLVTDVVQEIQAGGSTNFPHTLRATGNRGCGSFTLSHSTIPNGWSLNIFRDDGDNQLNTATDTLLDLAVPLPAISPTDTPYRLFAQLVAPPGAVVGERVTFTITATDTGGSPSCGSAQVTDLAIVVEGQLDLTKAQAQDANCDGVAETTFAVTDLSLSPGQCVMYRVIARNRSADPITNVTINDNIPTNTNFQGAMQPNGLIGSNSASSASCQSSATNFSGTAAAGKVGVNVVSSVNCGGANTMLPGATLTLQFAIQLDPLP